MRVMAWPEDNVCCALRALRMPADTSCYQALTNAVSQETFSSNHVPKKRFLPVL